MRWFALALALLLGCTAETPAPAPVQRPPAAEPQRIVSLAPALTSMLFRLGLGPRVVGVTRYCDDPPEAKNLPKIGGFADPNLEAVLGLRPELVVGVESPATAALLAKARNLGIATLAVKQDSLASTWSALQVLGEATGRADQARTLAETSKAELASLAAKAAGLRGRRALFVYGRGPLVVAGPGSYGDELLTLLGAQNAASTFSLPYPKLTAEEIVRAAPEIILDASVTMEAGDPSFWRDLPGLANARVEAVTHPGLMQPGPRVVEGLRWLVERFP